MTQSQSFASSQNALFMQYQEAIQSTPTKRARELAQTLNISEGELVACRQGRDTWQLQPSFQELLSSLESIGEVMTITRNDQVVHELTGQYRKLSFLQNGSMGLVLSADIDLRLFMKQWYSGFYVIENGRHSLQFFNKNGLAIHKVYRTKHSNIAAWNTVVERFKRTDPELTTFTLAEDKLPLSHDAPEGFDKELFTKNWAELQDVHDYHAMLRKHKLSRTQALAQIGEAWTTQLASNSIENAITFAQEESCEIMVFVGNPGCIQIFSGKVTNLVTKGPWFNVLDSGFNLHLRTDQIAEVWAIERPSSDGIITSIEAFDAYGNSILTLFGKRKPGIPELVLWRNIVQKVKSRLLVNQEHNQ